jgi:hypothetical protein
VYTVGDLIEYLGNLDPGMPVVIQKDAGGTAYSPLSAMGPCHYRSYNDWAGHVTSQPRKDDIVALVFAPVA